MRNSTIKAFATGMAVCAAIIAGIAFAAKATAVPVGDVDMSETAISYADSYKEYICGALLANPTPAGVITVLKMVNRDGWSAYDSGAIVGYAVMEACPAQWPVLEQFVAAVSPAAA
jgi:hypothetical protein